MADPTIMDWSSWWTWAEVAALVPAGIAGALLGDRLGLWLKGRGIGRQ